MGLNAGLLRRPTSLTSWTKTRDFYYTEPSRWQVVEERVDSADAERQFVWGLRYVDDLVLRDRDTGGNGIFDERLYALQDSNWNVTGVVNSSATLQERYSYSNCGVPQFLTAAFGSRPISAMDWDRLFGGYVWDIETQSFQIRNRLLVPYLGWVQRDPIGYLDGDYNLYRYVHNNPLLLTDPTGLWAGAAFCGAICVGCVGVPLIGLTTCYYSTSDGDQFADCWQAFWDNLPTWHKILWGVACVGCAACIIRLLWRICRKHKCSILSRIKQGTCGAASGASGCLTGGGNCKPGYSSAGFAALAGLWEACVAARSAYQSTCFSPNDPGWPGHIEAIQLAQKAAINCWTCAAQAAAQGM